MQRANPDQNVPTAYVEGWELKDTGCLDRKTFVTLPRLSPGGPLSTSCHGTVAEVRIESSAMQNAYLLTHLLYELNRKMEVELPDGKRVFDSTKFFSGPKCDDPARLAERNGIYAQYRQVAQAFESRAHRFGMNYRLPEMKPGEIHNPAKMNDLWNKLVILHRKIYSDTITERSSMDWQSLYMKHAYENDAKHRTVGRKPGEAWPADIIAPPTIPQQEIDTMKTDALAAHGNGRALH